jgi:hypothetical protein
MPYTKEEIENSLRELLYDCLSTANQESAIKTLSYNEETHECTIVMSTHINEEDNYIGFEGY